VYRLHGWKYQEGVTQGPRYVGKFINEFVYRRLPREVFTEIRRRNPVGYGQRRRYKHFQLLTENVGHPAIDRHLASVVTLMSIAESKDQFRDMFAQAFPNAGENALVVEPVEPSERERDLPADLQK
jgi:hypothetical protein